MFFKFIEADGRFAFSETPIDGFAEMPDAEHAALFVQLEQNPELVIGRDDEGRPAVVAPPPEPVASILARAIVDIRVQRAPILDALAGIGLDALVASDAATISAVSQARNDLKDITTLPGLLAAATYEEMKSVVMARYREIADSAPENVQTAFREIFAP